MLLSKWTCWTHASDTAPATLQCCDPDVKIIKNYTPYRWQRRFLPFRCHHPVNLIVTYARKLPAFAQNSDWMNFDVAFSFFSFFFLQRCSFRQKYQKACDHGINEKLEGTAYTADYALARGLGETEWFIPRSSTFGFRIARYVFLLVPIDGDTNLNWGKRVNFQLVYAT